MKDEQGGTNNPQRDPYITKKCVLIFDIIQMYGEMKDKSTNHQRICKLTPVVSVGCCKAKQIVSSKENDESKSSPVFHLKMNLYLCTCGKRDLHDRQCRF